ncbi:MAG TPA: hypothetical protein VFV40_08795 [Nocardioides sp.]|nr:hypothetical protein [Nocardioides sp.]
MRSDWIPLSASALVVGAMAMVFGALLNPQAGGGEQSAAETLRVVTEDGGRWLGMSVMYFFASVAMTLGLPSLLSLFTARGRRTGFVAVGVFSIGVIGLAGFAMLLVFFRALAGAQAIEDARLDVATEDLGLSVFLNGWIISFYAGLLLVAVALFLSKKTPPWVPGLMVVFVLLFPFANQIGRVGQVLQVMALAVAFTGVAVAAVNQVNRTVASRQPTY